MDCFIIMPYAPVFDDVLQAVETVLEKAGSGETISCHRLDRNPEAGRIAGRLETAIRNADLCIADLSPVASGGAVGANCNVMWEVGFAMALGKPTILISHGEFDLPFDVSGMQHIRYDRHRLKATLGEPLANVVQATVRRIGVDTVARLTTNGPLSSDQKVDALAEQVAELRGAMTDLCKHLVPSSPVLVDRASPKIVGSHRREPTHFLLAPDLLCAAGSPGLSGTWLNRSSGSCIYVALINEQWIAPYCYGGDGELTGVYYDWQPIGDHWFGRFKWCKENIQGFAFLKVQSADLLAGAWWYAENADARVESMPVLDSGESSVWERLPEQKFPRWATEFHELVRERGLEEAMRRV